MVLLSAGMVEVFPKGDFKSPCVVPSGPIGAWPSDPHPLPFTFQMHLPSVTLKSLHGLLVAFMPTAPGVEGRSGSNSCDAHTTSDEDMAANGLQTCV